MTSAHRINMDSQLMVVNRVTVTKVDQKVSNVMHSVNVHVTTMLKDVDAIDAKRTNTIVIKVVWIVPIATTWYGMLPMIIAVNWLI